MFNIVIGAYKEPIPGWIGNKHGPVLLFRAVRGGFVHMIQADVNESNLDLIPVDTTVNSLLASIWDYVVHRYYIILLKLFMKRLIKIAFCLKFYILVGVGKVIMNYSTILFYYSSFFSKEKRTNHEYIIMDLVFGILLAIKNCKRME